MNVVNPYIYIQPLILDLKPNAAVAYSLRKLRKAYAGECIRVRRSSDDTETDIGFVDDYLDTASLLTFVGANNGFVVTWYDQSGNAIDVTNSTNSKQPGIVSSGVLITENSKGAISLDGTSQYLTAGLGGSLTYSDSVSLFRVGNSDSLAGAKRFCSDDKVGVQGYFVDYFNNSNALYNDGAGYINLSQSILASSTQFIYSTCIKTNGDGEIDFNSSNETNSLAAWDGSIGTSGQAGFAIGSGADGGQLFDGKIQELIIYGSDKSSDKTEIRGNQNTFYSVY